LPERAAQRNDLRNQNPAERSEKKLTLRSPSPGGRGGQGGRTRLLDKVVRYRFGDNAELMGALGECPQCGWVVPDQERARVWGGR